MKITPKQHERELQRTSDRLTKAEAEELIEILCVNFSLPVPALRWTYRSSRGHAYPSQWSIAAGPLVWRGTTNCLLHEFAHLLTWHRFSCIGHSRLFLTVLREVVAAWFGDSNMNAYGWLTEYKTIAAAGPKDKQ